MSNFDFSKLIYDSETGNFYRTSNPSKPIGTINAGGYIVFRHNNKLVYAHRIAFAMTNGYFPILVDHINGNRADNRIVNLREASASLNSQNRKAAGFAKPKQTKKWSASITVNRKRKHLGYFDTPEEAHIAYLDAKKVQHPNALVS